MDYVPPASYGTGTQQAGPPRRAARAGSGRGGRVKRASVQPVPMRAMSPAQSSDPPAAVTRRRSAGLSPQRSLPESAAGPPDEARSRRSHSLTAPGSGEVAPGSSAVTPASPSTGRHSRTSSGSSW